MVPALVGAEAMLKRVLAEPGATKHLTHKPIVRTHNVLSEASNHCIVNEHMPGGSLWEWLRRCGCLPVEDAMRIAAAVCQGLDYAHKRGLVHCDLKPANILKLLGQSS